MISKYLKISSFFWSGAEFNNRKNISIWVHKLRTRPNTCSQCRKANLVENSHQYFCITNCFPPFSLVAFSIQPSKCWWIFNWIINSLCHSNSTSWPRLVLHKTQFIKAISGGFSELSNNVIMHRLINYFISRCIDSRSSKKSLNKLNWIRFRDILIKSLCASNSSWII